MIVGRTPLSWLAWSAFAAWLVLASGCSGNESDVTPSPTLTDAGPAEPDGAVYIDASHDGHPAAVDASVEGDAESDAARDAGDRMAFDTFTVADQGAIATTGTINGSASHGVRIVLGSGGYFCGGTGLAGASSIEINLSTTESSLLPSTYAITNGTGITTQVDAVFQLIDANCGSLARHPAHSGSINVTSIDATSVKGTYDIVFAGFGSHGRAVGGFVAPLCNAAQWGAHANCGP